MMSDKPIEPTTGLFAEFWHDYSSFLPRMNWRNFCFVHLEIEYDHMMGQLVWEICLLGFWYRGTYVYNDNTPTRQHLKQIVQEIDRT